MLHFSPLCYGCKENLRPVERDSYLNTGKVGGHFFFGLGFDPCNLFV
jgi:hypothetical protein